MTRARSQSATKKNARRGSIAKTAPRTARKKPAKSQSAATQPDRQASAAGRLSSRGRVNGQTTHNQAAVGILRAATPDSAMATGAEIVAEFSIGDAGANTPPGSTTALAAVVPGMPHPLLCPDSNPGWREIRTGYERLRGEIEASGADLIVIYSTHWPSVIGHQIQADPEPEWVHVDEEWHELGSIPYKLRMDATFAETLRQSAEARGLHARKVNYRGFPIDTGSIVALKLLNPNNRLPAVILSSNVYSDRAETILLGKATADALRRDKRRAAVLVVSCLSNRMFTDVISPAKDHIHSLKDNEWNLKLLEFLGQGRIEDAAQLSRQFHREARVAKVTSFKPMWWLAAVTGDSNNFTGNVHAYAPVYGTGCAVVSFTPARGAAANLEFDEDDTEVYRGDRNVLERSSANPGGEALRPLS